MQKLRILLIIIAISQLILGALTLFAPRFFFETMGLSTPPADNQYVIGMLAARFIAYGIGMLYLARMTNPNLFWVRNMVLVQALDFAVGAFYLGTGTIGVSVAAFPMFNAALFGILLLMWTNSRSPRTAQ